MPGFANLWSPRKLCWDVNGIFMFVLPEHLQAYKKNRDRAVLRGPRHVFTGQPGVSSFLCRDGRRHPHQRSQVSHTQASPCITTKSLPATGRFCFQGHGGMDRVAIDNASRMSMILRTEILLYWSTKEWRYLCVFPELEKW